MSRTRQGTRQELGACACLPCPETDQRVRLHFPSELTLYCVLVFGVSSVVSYFLIFVFISKGSQME